MIHIGFHGVQGNGILTAALLHGADGGCNLRRIGQRADGRTQQIKNGGQHILPLDLLSLYNVLQIDLGKQRFQIGHFSDVVGAGEDQRHTAVECVVVKGVLLIAADSRVVFGKGKRMHTDLIAAPPELRQDVRGQHFGVAAGHINVQVGQGLQIVEGVVKGDLLPGRIVWIRNFIGHLNFVYKEIILVCAVFHDLADVRGKLQRIAIANITGQVQLKGQNMVLGHPFAEKVILEQCVQQI